MNQTINNKPQRNITAILTERLDKMDKNLNDYLILKLANGEDLFVFPSKIKKINWTDFRNGKRYIFTVEEGHDSANILIDYQLRNYE